MASFGAAEEEADREAIARVVEASNATESPFAFYNLGCTKYYAQDFDGAIDVWKKLIEADVDPALTNQTLFQVARAMDGGGDVEGAMEMYGEFAK